MLLQIAWPLIGNYSCEINSACPKESNQGWRYFLFTMGGIMLLLWAVRFFLFKLYESPKYLMGRGRDQEAVDVIHKVAQANGTKSSLTVEVLRAFDVDAQAAAPDTSAKGALRRNLVGTFNRGLLKSLFGTRKLAWSTSLLIIIWGTLLHHSF